MGRCHALKPRSTAAFCVLKICLISYVSVINLMSLAVFGSETTLTDCGGHGRFNFCIGSDPECQIGCHCYDGYFFDKITLKCVQITRSTPTPETSGIITRRLLRRSNNFNSESSIRKRKFKKDKHMETFLRRRFTRILGREILRHLNNSLIRNINGRRGGDEDAKIVDMDIPVELSNINETDYGGASDFPSEEVADYWEGFTTESLILNTDIDVVTPETMIMPTIGRTEYNEDQPILPSPNLHPFISHTNIVSPFLYAVPFLSVSAMGIPNCMQRPFNFACTRSGPAVHSDTRRVSEPALAARARRSNLSYSRYQTTQPSLTEEEKILLKDILQLGIQTTTPPPKAKLRRFTGYEEISSTLKSTSSRPNENKSNTPDSVLNGRRSLVTNDSSKVPIKASTSREKFKSEAVHTKDSIKTETRNRTLVQAEQSTKISTVMDLDTRRNTHVKEISVPNEPQETFSYNSTNLHYSNNYVSAKAAGPNYNEHNANMRGKQVFSVQYPTYRSIRFKPVKFTNSRSGGQLYSVFEFEKPTEGRKFSSAFDTPHQTMEDNKKTLRNNNMYENDLNLFKWKNSSYASRDRAKPIVNNNYYINANERGAQILPKNQRDGVYLGIGINIDKVPIVKDMKQVYPKPRDIRVSDISFKNVQYSNTGNNYGNEYKRSSISLNNLNRPTFPKEMYRSGLNEAFSPNYDPLLSRGISTLTGNHPILKSSYISINNVFTN